MSYRVVFQNGEKRELVVEANSVKYNSDSSMLEFTNDSGVRVAFVPKECVLYIKKTD